MRIRLFSFLGMFAALAINSFAQPSEPETNSDFASPDRSVVACLTRPRIVPGKAVTVNAPVAVDTMSLEQTAFELLNNKRIERGLQPLAWNEQLATAARTHSQSMAHNNFFSHRGLDSKMVSDRADDVGLRKWRAIGENIAYNRGYEDPVGRAVEGWLDSSSHRNNLLDGNWKETAIGIAVTADGSYYLTQVFLKK